MKKRTKALMIPREVKERVYARDGGCCVWCGRAGLPEAHYIARSHSGLGVEENVLTLCRPCHERYDNSCYRAEMREYFRGYLKSKYPEWDENKLTYRKQIGGNQ